MEYSPTMYSPTTPYYVPGEFVYTPGSPVYVPGSPVYDPSAVRHRVAPAVALLSVPRGLQ